MPTKLQLDKEAWKWAESTQPEHVTDEHIKIAYRLPLKPCLRGTCKRNCKGNPFCLNAIGEKQWLEEVDAKKLGDFDPEIERREKNSYVGLKNLGATCYVNTFLQLWFHNRTVRQAMFKWRESDLPDIISENWTPSTICGQLQLIFSLLKYSEKRFIDPSFLINHLGLDTGLQQDAQEFSKLFLSLLEDAMSQSPDLNIIHKEFRGEYNYVITCDKCQGESKTRSMFYELDLNIQGHRTLHQALENFLQEEILEGDNQYQCSFCRDKQNARRRIKLTTLPTVLNLQLLRFFFDKKTGHKKKLNSFIQFPETLDMSKYLQTTDKPVIYELKAVLIHNGQSASSGHYTAHILSDHNKAWYKFNDETTGQMGRKLQLRVEEDSDFQIGKEQKPPKASKGFHSSKNSYMLVYTRQDDTKIEENEEEFEYSLLPSVVKDFIQKDNETFESWVSDILISKETNLESSKAKQSEIQNLYQMLLTESQDLDSIEWISSDWLCKWLNDPNDVKPVDNTQIICKHNKLDPDSISKVKCINHHGGEQLYLLYNGGPRLLGPDVLCRDCVTKRCQVTQLKLKMAADDQLINNSMKNFDNSSSYYWVGKSSFRSWKKIALSSLDNNTEPNTEKNCIKTDNNNGELNGKLPESESKTSESKSKISESETTETESKTSDLLPNDSHLNGNDESDTMSNEDSFLFNTDLLCDEHDNLSCDANSRKLVPEDVWKILYSYFPTSSQFSLDHPVCQQCQALTLEKSEKKLLKKKWIEEEKNNLIDLYLDRRRPTLDSDTELFIVSQWFVEQWRKYIKDNGKNGPIATINNSLLLCQHNLFIYSIDELTHHSNIVLLRRIEWERLCKDIGCDKEINVVSYTEENKTETIVIPGVCSECQQARLEEEEETRYIFTNSIIYVYKQLSRNCPSPPNTDPNEQDDANELRADKKQKLDEEFYRRKSQRRRKVRGEKEIVVSSNMTLKHLKIKIMNMFSVPTFDQNLTLDGRQITDNSLTLQQLKIYPGSNIILQVDEPSEENNLIEDFLTVNSSQEQGFKGTGLLSSS